MVNEYWLKGVEIQHNVPIILHNSDGIIHNSGIVMQAVGKPGDVVLDPFGGSMTAVAVLVAGRYVAKAIERVESKAKTNGK